VKRKYDCSSTGHALILSRLTRFNQLQHPTRVLNVIIGPHSEVNLVSESKVTGGALILPSRNNCLSRVGLIPRSLAASSVVTFIFGVATMQVRALLRVP
jgi:hypothetical protein